MAQLRRQRRDRDLFMQFAATDSERKRLDERYGREQTMTEWQPVETAPKGLPTENAGERGDSQWFVGLLKDGTSAKVRRLWSGHTYEWSDDQETYYSKDWLIGWKPAAE